MHMLGRGDLGWEAEKVVSSQKEESSNSKTDVLTGKKSPQRPVSHLSPWLPAPGRGGKDNKEES